MSMRKTLVGVAVSAALCGSASAQEHLVRVAFNIAPQPMGRALTDLGEQAGLEVLVSGKDLQGGKQLDQPVRGELTVRAALEKVLANSGLTYEFLDERTVRVRTAQSDGAKGEGKGERKAEESGPPLAAAQSRPREIEEAAIGEADSAGSEQSRASATRPIQEVVVTGSHIRGATPVGANIIEIDRAEIDRSGYATVQDVIRSLPQNFSGGPNEYTRSQLSGIGVDADSLNNFTNATAANLRGLGAGSTLVLVDGRRFAPGGAEGTFVDMSSVPVTAIERVEILPDGASAIYGSDAVGGVINFQLRKQYDGAETQARIGSLTNGGSRQYQFSQTIGKNWGSGNGLLSYEYYKREALPVSERAQAADSDLRFLGGDNFDTPNGNPGTVFTDDGQSFAVPLNQNGTGLTPGSFSTGTQNLSNTHAHQDLFGLQQKNSVFGTFSQRLTERLELFGDAMFTKRDVTTHGPGLTIDLPVPTTNAFYVNPTGGTDQVRVAYNLYRDIGGVDSDQTVQTYQGTFGVNLRLSDTWELKGNAQYGRELQRQVSSDINRPALDAALADSNPETAFNAFGDGSFTNPATLLSVKALAFQNTTSKLHSVNLVADGALMQLPGGLVRLAIGADYRHQDFESSVRPPTEVPTQRKFERHVSAGFAELLVPLVGVDNAITGIRRLELSVAGRYEKYNDFGDSTNPKVGVSWVPVDRLMIRGSWGTSFKAPNLADLDTSNNQLLIFRLPDDQAPPSEGGTSPVLIAVGKNSGVVEETADIWTAGIDFTPSENARFGVTYFHINFKNRIEAPLFSFNVLNQSSLAAIVTRNPTADQRTAVCGAGTFFGVPGDCLNAPIGAIVDLRTNNTAITRTEGFDFLAGYDFDSAIGRFSADLNATYLTEFQKAQVKSSPLVDLLDTPANPLDLRLRGSFAWSRGPLNASLFVNYADGYEDNISVPNRSISSWLTFDFNVTYAFGADAPLLVSNTALSLNVQNLFDKNPPFYNNAAGLGFDPTNANLLGRSATIQLRKSW